LPYAPCLKVQKRLGEKAILLVNRLGLIDKRFKVQRVDDYILIPLITEPEKKSLEEFNEELKSFEISKFDFAFVEKIPKSLADILERTLPPHLLASLPKSVDVIGDIAVVEIAPELEAQRKMIGEAILVLHKNVRTVLGKSSAIGGPYRVREFEVVAGVGKTETTHCEHNCVYRLDVAKVYFSPRLSYEHERVAAQVKNGEIVLDMFAGVGPFSILIAKKHKVKVYSIDINPDAAHYLKQNIVLNKVQTRVVVMQGDARKLVEKDFSGIFDRVIMNLPVEAISYVDVACRALKPDGGVIHYYEFAAEPNPLDKARERFSEAVIRAGREIKEILTMRVVKPAAPFEWLVAVDALIR